MAPASHVGQHHAGPLAAAATPVSTATACCAALHCSPAGGVCRQGAAQQSRPGGRAAATGAYTPYPGVCTAVTVSKQQCVYLERNEDLPCMSPMPVVADACRRPSIAVQS
jgi:hypothetical protein